MLGVASEPTVTLNVELQVWEGKSLPEQEELNLTISQEDGFEV